jgi:hypothetical protein
MQTDASENAGFTEEAFLLPLLPLALETATDTLLWHQRLTKCVRGMKHAILHEQC